MAGMACALQVGRIKEVRLVSVMYGDINICSNNVVNIRAEGVAFAKDSNLAQGIARQHESSCATPSCLVIELEQFDIAPSDLSISIGIARDILTGMNFTIV